MESNDKLGAFILEAVAEDLKSGRFKYIRTRLPPRSEATT